MVKKILCLTLAACMALFLPSCTVPDFTTGRDASIEMNKVLIEALNDRDVEKVKSLLCEQTLAIEDIDEQITAMFDFFEEGVLPIKEEEIVYSRAGSESGSFRNGVETLQVNASQYIRSECGKEYSILMAAYTKTSNPNIKGVSWIWVTDETDLPGNMEERDKVFQEKERNCYVGKLIE